MYRYYCIRKFNHNMVRHIRLQQPLRAYIYYSYDNRLKSVTVDVFE